jgi:hypothetical protein
LNTQAEIRYFLPAGQWFSSFSLREKVRMRALVEAMALTLPKGRG